MVRFKKKTSTSELDKTNKQKEKRPREGTRNRDPLIHTLGNLIKTPKCHNIYAKDLYGKKREENI